jgi:arsenite methyltransferase
VGYGNRALATSRPRLRVHCETLSGGSYSSAMSDRWAEWLRNRRDGGSVEQRRAALEFLGPIRDQILDSAEVGAGDVLLDVGCGDGLVGLGALDRGAQVIFSDISQACLDDCRAIAHDAAEYWLASAVNLGEVQADVVTTRSVLIYVADKPRAFAEFFRVLRPGGRLSIFEPINRFGLEERRATYGFRDLAGVEDLFSRVVAEVDRAEEGAGGLDAMIDFDERDLVRFAEDAGFENIRLTLNAEVTNEAKWRSSDWDVFLDSSPNPLSPTFREAMRAALQPDEQARLAAVIRPQVEAGRGTTRLAKAFLTARRPMD